MRAGGCFRELRTPPDCLMDPGLKGKGAAVAAASRGLGRASARALAREGASVAMCGRDDARIKEAADEVARETGARTMPVVADVGVAEDCRRFVDSAAEEFGRLDILVTNTGGPKPGAFDAVDERRWEEAFRTTLANVFRPAIVGLAKTLANELGPDGILVNTVCPGYTRTDRLQEVSEARAKASGTTPDKILAELASSVPLGRGLL